MPLPDDVDRLGQSLAAVVPDFDKFVDLMDKFADSADQLGDALERATELAEQMAEAVSGSNGGPGGGDDGEEEVAKKKKKAGQAGADFNRMLNVLSTTMHGVSTAANVANLLLYGFHSELTKLGGHMAGFVKLLSPAVVIEYERSLAALHAQFGTVFAPLLQGLTGVVRLMANAFAGLSGNGKLFIAVMAGAVVGLTAVVTAGGIFIGILSAVAAGAIAGAVAFTVLGKGLESATAGFSGIGALIGGLVATVGTGLAASAGAGAGGLASMMLANGTVEKLTAAFKPFVEVLIGTFNAVGDKLVPKLTQVATEIMPTLSRVFEIAAQYIEPFADVLAEFAIDILPPMLSIFGDLLEAALPLVVVLAKLVQFLVWGVGVIMQFSAAVSSLLGKMNVLNMAFRAITGGPAKGQLGNAPSPITGASFTAVEDAFKRAQEQAVIGTKADKVDPMERSDVRSSWAQAIGAEVAKAVSSLTSGKANAVAVGASLLDAIAKGASRSPTG